MTWRHGMQWNRWRHPGAAPCGSRPPSGRAELSSFRFRSFIEPWVDGFRPQSPARLCPTSNVFYLFCFLKYPHLFFYFRQIVTWIWIRYQFSWLIHVLFHPSFKSPRSVTKRYIIFSTCFYCLSSAARKNRRISRSGTEKKRKKRFPWREKDT